METSTYVGGVSGCQCNNTLSTRMEYVFNCSILSVDPPSTDLREVPQLLVELERLPVPGVEQPHLVEPW